MHHELRIIEQVALRASGPVHLVGHSFGGTVALAAALANCVDVASLALFEANPLALIRQLAEPLYQEVLSLSHEFEAAVDAGDVDAAARIIDFWGGRGTFDAMPQAVRDYCKQTAPANVFDWRTDFGFQADSPDYAAIDVPVLLVRGAGANPAMVIMTEALVQALPDVRSGIVPGAGHFLITTHARECAALLAAFLNDVS
jgi:pimeloyl-ACP methyl ester carboxylesterase